MQYFNLNVFKDEAGLYANGRIRPIPSDAQMRGIDRILMGDPDDILCPPDQPPYKNLLHLWSITTDSVWVDETIQSFEDKRAECCTGGSGALSSVAMAFDAPVTTATHPTLIDKTIDLIVYNQYDGSGNLTSSTLLSAYTLDNSTGEIDFTAMGGLAGNTGIDIIYH